MSKNGPQCKIGTRETKALAKALESSYPINEQTILAKIESFQTAYDKDPMYVPSVPEMKAFLDLQAAQGDLVIPVSQISNLRKQVEEGTATMQRVGGIIYIATKSGMVVKVLPNNTMVVTNPSDTSEEGIALHQAFDTFFSKTSEAGPEEDEIKWGRFSDNGYEVSTRGDKRFSALVATFKKGTVIDGVDVGGRTIEDVYQHVIKKSRKGQAPAKDSRLYNEALKTKEERENFSYTEGYLPLWQEWAKQNPELMDELRAKLAGKTLTDQFANTRVSQARALADILNSMRDKKNTGIFATTNKKEYWDRSAVEKDKETLYIFTDNTDRDSGSGKIDPNSKYAQKYGKDKHYPKQTAAVIRGLDNAMPISTQRWYHKGAKGDTGMWQDADAEEFEKVIKEEVDSIIEEWKSGKYKKVVIPSGDGFFGEGSRSISKINKTRVPELYRILTEQLTRLEEAIGKDNISPFTKNTDMQTSSIEIPGVKLIEDTERSYLSRTRQNAEWSDVTIALGEDLTTAGELQTAKLAGAEVVEEERTNARGEKYTTVTKVTNPKKGKYVGINLNIVSSAEAIAMEIYNQIIERNLPTDNIKLNIAGNGIYTLKSEQAFYDKLLAEVLKALQDKGITISEVRSGGQSGIDEAGIKAAVSLGLKASILAPKGYRFRGKDNKDISNK